MLPRLTLHEPNDLVSFELTLPGADQPARILGRWRRDSAFSLAVHPDTLSQDSLTVSSDPLPPPLMATVALALQRKLRVGERASVRVFDPLLLRERAVGMSVIAESTFATPDSAEYDSAMAAWVPAHLDTLRAWLVSRNDGDGFRQLWVDARGLPVRSVGRTGLMLERSAFEIVNVNYRRVRQAHGEAGWTGPIIPRTALKAGATIPTSRLSRLVLRVRAGDSLSPDPGSLQAGRRQRLHADTLEIREVGPETVTGAPLTAELREHWLADGPMLDVGSPTVQNLAREITHGATDAAASRRLTEWVARNIKAAPVSIPIGAAAAIAARRGDADHHTLVLVALARAAGIPARPVSGLLFTPQGLFYLHSWVEVHLGGWIAVDPTAGQFPADAARIRMEVDALSQPMELLPTLAGLQIDILDAMESR